MTRIFKMALLGAILLAMSLHGRGMVLPKSDAENIVLEEDDTPLYLGIGLVAAKLHSCGNSCTYEDETYGIMLRAGYDLNEYFGVEVRAMRTFLDKGPFGGAPIQHIGIFAKPQYSINDDFNIYGLLGYGYTENLGNGLRLNYFDNDYGVSAGLGFEYYFSDEEYDDEQGTDNLKKWSIFLDYQRLLIESDVPDMDAVSLGLRYNF